MFTSLSSDFFKSRAPGVSRRDFLKLGGMSLIAGFSLSDLLRQKEARAEKAIFAFLRGGPSTSDPFSASEAKVASDSKIVSDTVAAADDESGDGNSDGGDGDGGKKEESGGDGGDEEDDIGGATVIAACIVVAILLTLAQFDLDKYFSPSGGLGGILAFLAHNFRRHKTLGSALKHAALNGLCGSLIAVPIVLILHAWQPQALAFFAGACWFNLLVILQKKCRQFAQLLS